MSSELLNFKHNFDAALEYLDDADQDLATLAFDTNSQWAELNQARANFKRAVKDLQNSITPIWMAIQIEQAEYDLQAALHE